MELFVNDLSINGQFHDIPSFLQAIDRLMEMRSKSRQFERELYCHRNIAHAKVTSEFTLRQAIQRLGRDKQRALMQWLTRDGPFWEDDRVHDPEDYLECNGEIVTDTAIGEATFRSFNGSDCQLISMMPSSWGHSPIKVVWRKTDDDYLALNLTNHTEIDSLETALRSAPVPLDSWDTMGSVCVARFGTIIFSEDTFEPLLGYPFALGAANRIVERLDVLSRFKSCFDKDGERTPEGHRLYRDYFTGDKAWFSDSSDTEKNDYRSELTFIHPEKSGEKLFCPWHGKVKTPQIRIHFSWPVSANTPLYVTYVGPKLTKR